LPVADRLCAVDCLPTGDWEGTDMCRLASFVLLLVVAAASTGCCYNCRGWHGRHWCGPSCGECYWSEWFNDPPDCCDPCDCYGNYAGPKYHPVMHAAYHDEPTLAAPGHGVPTPASQGMEEMPSPVPNGAPRSAPDSRPRDERQPNRLPSHAGPADDLGGTPGTETPRTEIIEEMPMDELGTPGIDDLPTYDEQ
jgi:hypothetical protein